jgi:hypothetical protein
VLIFQHYTQPSPLWHEIQCHTCTFTNSWHQAIDTLYEQRTELTAILSSSFQLNKGSEPPVELANAFPANLAEDGLGMREELGAAATVGLSSGCSLSHRTIGGHVLFGKMHRFF